MRNEEHFHSVGRLPVAVIRQPWVPYATATLAFRAGSAYEDASTFGFSHFLEHLVFHSLPHDTARAVERIEALGGELDASTGRETTFFELKIALDELPAGLEALGRLGFELRLDPDDFEREKEVLEHEAYEDDPRDELDMAAKELLWPDDKLADDSLGDLGLIQEARPADLVAHHGRHYVPGNALLVVAGGVDIAATVSLVERLFAAHGRIPGERADYRAPRSNQDRPIVESRQAAESDDDDQAPVDLVLAFRGWAYNEPHNLRSYVLSELLGGAQTSRLFKSLREDDPITYALDSYVDSFLHAGCFSVRGGVVRENLDHAFEVICDNLAELRQLGPREDECEMARRALETFFGSDLYTPSQATDFAVRRYLLDLAPEWWDPAAFTRALGTCNRGGLRETARGLFRPERAVVALLGETSPRLRRRLVSQLERALGERK